MLLIWREITARGKQWEGLNLVASDVMQLKGRILSIHLCNTGNYHHTYISLKLELALILSDLRHEKCLILVRMI